LLRLGIPLIPGFAFLFVIQQGNKYVLQWFGGLGAVGVYTIGFNLGLAMSLVVSAFQKAWLPYFMSFVDKPEEARVLFGRILTYYVFGFGALNLLFFIAARPVVMLMTQPAFYDAYKVVGLSASAQFWFGVYILLLPGMYFAKEVQYQSLILLIATFIAIGIDFLLILSLGLFGAGLALTLGSMAISILTYLWNLKRRREYLNVLYEWHRLLAFVVIYVFCMVLMLLERHFSLLSEVAISTVAFILLSMILYTFLNHNERLVLWVTTKHLSRIVLGLTSSKI